MRFAVRRVLSMCRTGQAEIYSRERRRNIFLKVGIKMEVNTLTIVTTLTVNDEEKQDSCF
jgi:hypothetical protein